MPTLTFLGAARTVTGSKYLLDFGDHRLLVDCGLFQGLKELRDLNLYRSKITDAGLGHLKGLPGLRRLTLENAAITDAGCQDFQRAMPKAKVAR